MNLNQVKKLIFLSLFLILRPLQGNHSKIQKSLFVLLKQTHIAQNYWGTIEYQKYRRFLKIVPWQWGDVWNNTNIKKKQKLLAQLKQELASTLGATISSPEDHSQQNTSLNNKIQKARDVLKVCAPPPHYQLHWARYTAIIALLASGLWLIHQKQNSDILYIINGPDVKNILKGSLKTRNYHYTKDESFQYLRIKKNNTDLFEPLLEHEGISFVKFDPTVKDLSLYGYDESGKNLLHNFYHEHVKKPAKNIVSIISKDNENDPTLVQDIEAAEKILFDDLDDLIRHAYKNKETRSIVEEYTQGKPLEEVPPISKLKFLDRMMAFTNKKTLSTAMETVEKFKVQPSDHDFSSIQKVPVIGKEGHSLAMKSDSIMNTVTYGLKLLQHNIDKNSDFYQLSFETYSLYLNQLRLEKSVLMNKIHELSEKLHLNFELMATIPAMLLTYATYRVCSSVFSNFTRTHILKPLKKDLIQFQLLLNKERHVVDVHKTSLIYKGMCFYWIKQLKEYSRNISSTARYSYNQYIDQLSNVSITPAQKLTIIECMFREYEFLR